MPDPNLNKSSLSTVSGAVQGHGLGRGRMIKLLISLPRREWLFCLCLFAATVIAYQPAWQGKPIWDDDAHLTPPAFRSLDGLARIWLEPGDTQQYYPLTYSFFWVEHVLWGDATLGYHFVNILLHAFSALLLWKILRRLEVPGACLAAAIFALHPVCVESVAWMSELKNTLSGALYLGAALVYLRFDRIRNWKFYYVALGLFLLGLLAKTDIATLPAALLVVFWWQRAKLFWKQDVWPLIPFFGLAMGAGLFTAWMEWTVVGARGSEFSFSIIDRFLIAGRAIWFYLGELVWPVDLTFNYPRWNIDQTLGWQYLFPAAALLFLTALWLLSRRNRGPLAAMLFFVGTLFPALGFINAYPFRYSFVADHFQYLASIGPILLAAAAIDQLFRSLKNRQPFLKPLFCGTLLLVLGALTWCQCGMYSDSETLWRVTIARNPTSWLAHNSLGLLLKHQGRTKEAIEQYHQALQIKPDSWEVLNNLGNTFYDKGQFDEAVDYYLRALDKWPDYQVAKKNLGNALLLEGQSEPAMAHYQAAIKLEPNNVMFLNNLAWRLATSPQARLRNGPEAVQLAEQACQLTGYQQPQFVGTLAAAYAEAGRFEEAVTTSESAYNLAQSLGQESLALKDQQLLQLFKARQTYQEQAGQ